MLFLQLYLNQKILVQNLEFMILYILLLLLYIFFTFLNQQNNYNNAVAFISDILSDQLGLCFGTISNNYIYVTEIFEPITTSLSREIIILHTFILNIYILISENYKRL